MANDLENGPESDQPRSGWSPLQAVASLALPPALPKSAQVANVLEATRATAELATKLAKHFGNNAGDASKHYGFLRNALARAAPDEWREASLGEQRALRILLAWCHGLDQSCNVQAQFPSRLRPRDAIALLRLHQRGPADDCGLALFRIADCTASDAPGVARAFRTLLGPQTEVQNYKEPAASANAKLKTVNRRIWELICDACDTLWALVHVDELQGTQLLLVPRMQQARLPLTRQTGFYPSYARVFAAIVNGESDLTRRNGASCLLRWLDWDVDASWIRSFETLRFAELLKRLDDDLFQDDFQSFTRGLFGYLARFECTRYLRRSAVSQLNRLIELLVSMGKFLSITNGLIPTLESFKRGEVVAPVAGDQWAIPELIDLLEYENLRSDILEAVFCALSASAPPGVADFQRKPWLFDPLHEPIEFVEKWKSVAESSYPDFQVEFAHRAPAYEALMRLCYRAENRQRCDQLRLKPGHIMCNPRLFAHALPLLPSEKPGTILMPSPFLLHEKLPAHALQKPISRAVPLTDVSLATLSQLTSPETSWLSAELDYRL